MLDKITSARRWTLGRMAHAIALSALILFSSLAQTVHESMTAHAVCPEHGELLDITPQHFDAAPVEVPGRAHVHAFDSHVADPSANGSHAKPSDAPSGHDECWFATLLRPGSSHWVGAPAPFIPLSRVACDDTIRPCVRAAAIPPLSFAPKHSPPARAA